MKITAIRAYQVDLPLHEGSYKWSGGNAVSVFDSTVVAVETDAGLTGWGEVCPLGPAYLPAYARGARAGIAELAPQLLGADPLRARASSTSGWTAAMRGHPYVKSAIDMACWDLLGKASRPAGGDAAGRARRRGLRALPRDLAGVAGADGEEDRQVPHGGVPQVPAQGRRRSGHRHRRGSRRPRRCCSAGDVLIADANTGWTQHEAVRVADAVRDVDVYIEQPCLTYEECLAVRRHTDRPFVLDEVIDGLDMVRARHRRPRDGRDQPQDLQGRRPHASARQIRDLCVSLGIAMTIEDTWGGDITTAAIAHLAHSTPERFLFSSTDFNCYVTVAFADGAPQRKHGRLAASRAPGLGVKPIMKVLGKPVLEVGKTGKR